MEQASQLAELDRTRDSFVRALAAAPDAALTFLKPGDDYALGGLLVHVNAVLEHYREVLDGILAAGYGQYRANDVADISEPARAGLEPTARAPAMARLEELHGELRDRLAGLSAVDFERQAPVIYHGSTEPYPTSPAAILGWVAGHYEEHVPQIAELLTEYARSG